jgi:LmbE family N-acetylglucosaminyl deacetylase
VNVVCVFAHQDDENAGLGTLLRLHRERDARITFVTIANGELGASWDPSKPLDEVAATRAREMGAVAAAFDGEHICLGRRDGFVFEDTELRLELTEVLRAAAAELVFTHAPSEYNADHDITSHVTVQAALAAEIASLATSTPALAAAPKIFYSDPGAGYGFEATLFVPFDEEIATEKARILSLHESQTSVMTDLFGSDWVELVRSRDKVCGARLPAPYAEGFRPCLHERRVPFGGLLP